MKKKEVDLLFEAMRTISYQSKLPREWDEYGECNKRLEEIKEQIEEINNEPTYDSKQISNPLAL